MVPLALPLRLAESLGALSLATDAASDLPPEKVLRTVLLAGGLARAHGLSPDQVQAAWWMPLLRYLGCTGFAHEEAWIYGAGDDISVRRTMVAADLADPEGTLQAIQAGIAPAAPEAARQAAIGRLLGDGRAVVGHAHAQCEASLHLARLAGVAEALLPPLAQVSERWDGRGVPAGLAGQALDPAIRVLHVADVAEITWHRRGTAAALAEVARRAGGQLDPALCRTFAEEGAALLGGLVGGSVWDRFLDDEPRPWLAVPADRVEGAALAFAHFADLKSASTLGHSTAVARLCDRAAAILGLPAEARQGLRLAALLHDLGRVAVPNAVWDKPGPLTWAEREAARSHSVRTERLLQAAPPFRPLAALAAAAHERLDGSGYHRAIPRVLLDVPARILAAADARQAMREPRPHRPPLSSEAAARALAEEVAAGRLDAEAVRAVLMAAGDEDGAVRPANPRGLSDREVEVLGLLARGRSNKEIAQALQISPKTVQHHVAHVYEKVGVASRAAAALFAVEAGLLTA